MKIIAGKEITFAVAERKTEKSYDCRIFVFFFHSCIRYFLLVLSLAPRGFFPGTPVFPFPKKQHFQSPIRPGIRSTKNHYINVLPLNRYLFISLIEMIFAFVFIVTL